jgi:hypothetical protein
MFSRSSSKLEARFKAARDARALPKLLLKYDCKTRWGSTYEMIYRYLQVVKAYDETLAQEKNANDLHLLSDEDNEHLKTLCVLLQQFYTITTWLCTQK